MQNPIKAHLLTTSFIISALSVPAYAGGAVLDNTSALTGATVSIVGKNTTITQKASKVDIKWNDFSSAADESIRFIQPNANAIAINRVTSGKQSLLLGKLDANGHIVIVNDAGIVFGAGSQTNVGALTASTAKNFVLNNNGTYTATDFSGNSVTVHGTINTPNGYVFLLAKEVNVGPTGAINAKTINLQAGARAYTVALTGTGKITYTTDKLDKGAVNVLGGLTSTGGIIIKAQANDVANAVMNLNGVIDVKASTLSAASDGDINLQGAMKSTGTLDLTAGRNINLNTATLTGKTITLAAKGDAEAIAGTSSITSSGTTSITGDLFAANGSNLNVNAKTLDLTGSLANKPVDGTGSISLSSAGTLTLTNAVIGGGDVNVTGKTTTLKGDVNSYAKNLNINYSTDAVVKTNFISKNGGNITLHSPKKITVTGTAAAPVKLDAGTGSITLHSGSDAAISYANLSGNTVSVNSDSKLTIGKNLNVATGNLNLTAAGYLTLPLTNTNNGNINLSSKASIFTGDIFAGSGSISLNSNGGMTIGNLSSGNLSVKMNGVLDTQASALNLKSIGDININGWLNSSKSLNVSAGKSLNIGNDLSASAISNSYNGTTTFTSGDNLNINNAAISNTLGTISVTAGKALNIANNSVLNSKTNTLSGVNTNIDSSRVTGGLVSNSTANTNITYSDVAGEITLTSGNDVSLIGDIGGTGKVSITAARDIRLGTPVVGDDTYISTTNGDVGIKAGGNLYAYENNSGFISYNGTVTLNSGADTYLRYSTISSNKSVGINSTGKINLAEVNFNLDTDPAHTTYNLPSKAAVTSGGDINVVGNIASYGTALALNSGNNLNISGTSDTSRISLDTNGFGSLALKSTGDTAIQYANLNGLAVTSSSANYSAKNSTINNTSLNISAANKLSMVNSDTIAPGYGTATLAAKQISLDSSVIANADEITLTAVNDLSLANSSLFSSAGHGRITLASTAGNVNLTSDLMLNPGTVKVTAAGSLTATDTAAATTSQSATVTASSGDGISHPVTTSYSIETDAEGNSYVLNWYHLN